MSKLAEYKVRQAKVDELWEKYEEHADELKSCKNEKQEYELSLNRVKNAPKLKRKGNFLIFLGFVLIIAEVLAVMYHSPFEPVDAVIIGAVFLWGLLRKRAGRKEYREAMEKSVFSAEELTQKIAALDAKIQLYSKEEADYYVAQQELDRMLRYTGKEWDLYNVRLDSRTVSALERDLNDLMFVLGRSTDSDYVLNNWFALSRLEAMTARVSNNSTVTSKEDAMLRKLGDSTSWILVATSIAMSVIELNLMRFAWKEGEPMTFEEALNMSKSRPAVSAEEIEYQENLTLAVENIVYFTTKKLGKMLK